jgi:vitamin B12 transporter
VLARHTIAEKDFDPAPFPAFVPADGDRESKSTQTYIMGRAKLDLFDGGWQHIASVAFTDTDNDNFANGEENTSTQGEKLKFSYQTSIFFDTTAFADASHTVTLAIETETEKFKQTGKASFFGDPNQEQRFTNNGFVAEYRLDLWDRLFISTSVRYDDNDLFENPITYRGSIAYNITTTGTTLRGAYGTAVKNPSFTDRFGFTPDTFFGNPNLDPERSKGWEVGIDQDLFNDRMRISLTFFHERLEDEINGFFFDPILGTFGGFTAVNIDGESERKGVEVSVQTDITDSLMIIGSYTYVDSTQENVLGKQVREIRRPEHVASLNANYRFLNDKANINLGINYTGKQNDNDFSTFPATPVSLDDYVLVNLAAEYSFTENISLFGRIENLLNQDYRDIFGFDTPGIAGYAGIRMNLDL